MWFCPGDSLASKDSKQNFVKDHGLNLLLNVRFTFIDFWSGFLTLPTPILLSYIAKGPEGEPNSNIA